MSREKLPDESRMSAAVLRLLSAEAEGQPEKLTELVKRLVLQTIDEVRECHDEGATERSG